jgi:hypothetical protein
MSRPLRIELSGGLYHVTLRGYRREAIYRDARDRTDWLGILGEDCSRFNWRYHAYCEMSNHYHFVVETLDGNLSNVRQGTGEPSVWEGLRHQVFLGTEAFVQCHRAVSKPSDRLREVPRTQR